MGRGSQTFSVLIPALNEANNIGNLIYDVLEQELDDSLVLEKLLVVSDGSTDDTNDIVMKCAAADNRVELTINPRRIGKPMSLNIGMRQVTSDFLVLLDGDVRLCLPQTLRNLLMGFDTDVGIVGGNPVPADDSGSFAALVARCGDILRNDVFIRIRDGCNIFSAHGRIMALSRQFYSTVEIPIEKDGRQMVSDDQYLYLSCIEKNLRYVYRGDAEVLYRLPTSFMDYLRQSVRFMASFKETTAFFDDTEVASEYHIPFKIKAVAFTNLCRREPGGAFAWTLYRLIGRLLHTAKRLGFSKRVGTKWDVSKSTKEEIIGPR